MHAPNSAAIGRQSGQGEREKRSVTESGGHAPERKSRVGLRAAAAAAAITLVLA